MAASKSDTKEGDLHRIVTLLKEAERRVLSITEEEKKAGRIAYVSETVWLNFRYIVFDLYDVLNYAYYFLRCHFSYNGRPDLTKDAIRLGFPYSPEGVQISDSEQDQTDKFVSKHLINLCQSNQRMEKDAEAIIRYIRELQPKRKGSTGEVVEHKEDEEGAVEVLEGDAECLAMLYFYRNCVIHRDLIRFLPETSWVQFNQATGCYQYVNESQKKGEGTYWQQLDGQRFWIELPGCIKGEERHRLLSHVLHDLQCFVRKTFAKLLQLGGIQFQIPNGMFCALFAVSTYI